MRPSKKPLVPASFAVVRQEQPRRPEGRVVPPSRGGGESYLSFVDNRPALLAQRKVQETAEKTVQRKPVNARVVGVSHLVSFQSDGLLAENYLSNEGPLLEQDSDLKIDDERIHVSRRGPNQESNPSDVQGPVQYPWFKVLALGGRPLDGDFFVRADALTLENGSSPKLTDDQVKSLDLSMPAYMASQKSYQDSLRNIPESKIFANHRSVGFEFEFGKHDRPRMPAHIILAKSNQFSALFNLPFVLETDSGGVLEVGFPPLIFRNRPGGGPNSSAMSHVFRKAQTTMDSIGKMAGEGLGDLCKEISRAGFGEKWDIEEKYRGMKTEDKSQVEKFKGRGVYSQINISLTSEESAKMIEVMEGAEEGTAEKGVLGVRYQELLGMLKGTTPEPAKIHLAKVFVNLFAALDISRAKDSRVPKRKGFDLASTVKELYGVWVKDSPANILSPFRDVIDKDDVECAYSYTEMKLREDIGELQKMEGDSPSVATARDIQKKVDKEYTPQ